MSHMSIEPILAEQEWYYVQVTYAVTGGTYKTIAYREDGRWYITGQATDMWAEHPETFAVKIMSRIDLDLCKFEDFRH